MEIVEDIFDFHARRPGIVTLGKFDGLHRGHCKLIRKVCSLADRSREETVVFTFSVSPQVRMGRQAEPVLMTASERREMIRSLGIDLVVECPFTDEIRNMEAETFVREILVERLQMRAAVVGPDFFFGRKRGGDPDLLRALGQKYGFEVYMLEKEQEAGLDISSSRIRETVRMGRMEEAAKLLGYSYFIESRIIHGRHLGHSLGFPTINQVPPDQKLLPPFGVYVTTVEIEGRRFWGVSNLGTKPTVDGRAVGLETYLFDCEEDLYGKTARVNLLSFRRAEARFSDLEELMAAMQADMRDAEAYFLTLKH